jgi:hypothetical protein
MGLISADSRVHRDFTDAVVFIAMGSVLWLLPARREAATPGNCANRRKAERSVLASNWPQ